MKSALIAIGTELTDGQIVNTNASWISARLKAFGPRVQKHFAVPDDHALMLESLSAAASAADLIFVTGGLGPTSDDFTRNVVAEWAGVSLEFHDSSWAAIVERLTSRGYPVQDFQKQQCYFPKGATVLTNSQGTANGFLTRARDRWLVVLPGPPREIQAIWNDHLVAWLTELCKGLDPMLTHSWDTMGLGESQVAAMVEPLVQGQGAEIGYRVHLPYVEFKISFPKSATAKYSSLVQQIEKTLSSITLARNGDDIAETFARRISAFERVTFIDDASGSFLLARLLAPLRDYLSQGQWEFRSSGEPCESSFWIRKINEFSVTVGSCLNGKISETTIEAPYKTENMSERRKQYFVERALVEWYGLLS